MHIHVISKFIFLCPQDNEDVIQITQIINWLLEIVMFQNSLIIGDIQGKNQFSTPIFSLDSLGHDKGYAFIEMKIFFYIFYKF